MSFNKVLAKSEDVIKNTYNDNQNELERAFTELDNELSNEVSRLETEIETVDNRIIEPADYIIEEGRNSNGNYEKWASGKLVQWGYEDIVGANEGNGKNVNYPIAFVSTQCILTQITRRADTGIAYPIVNISNSTNNHFRVFHSSSASIAVQLYWNAIGTWK